MTGVEIIDSEFGKGCGEILPYIYYARNRWFDTAVIIHDSVFFQRFVDFGGCRDYNILWGFEHYWDQPADETRIIKNLNNYDRLLKFRANKSLWDGCFGSMCVITFEFLKLLDETYGLGRLADVVVNRYNRISFERVIASILQLETGRRPTMFGDINKYCRYGGDFGWYLENKKTSILPLVKVWTGR